MACTCSCCQIDSHVQLPYSADWLSTYEDSNCMCLSTINYQPRRTFSIGTQAPPQLLGRTSLEYCSIPSCCDRSILRFNLTIVEAFLNKMKIRNIPLQSLRVPNSIEATYTIPHFFASPNLSSQHWNT